MPSKLAIAFLGMVVGGSAFTFAGLTTFLTVISYRVVKFRLLRSRLLP